MVSVRFDRVQEVVDYFKDYLRKATGVYEQRIRASLERENREKEQQIRNAIAQEEQRLHVLKNVKIDN